MSQENETLDEKSNEKTGEESKQNQSKESELLKEIFTKNEKIKLMSEALGLEKGFSIDELSKILDEKNKQKKLESERLEKERLEKMTKVELLEEQVKNMTNQFKSIEEKSKLESRKSQIQEALLKEGVIESKISSITKLAMIEDNGTDPNEFVKNVFKVNNLDLFKSDIKNGADLGKPNNPPDKKEWTGKFSGTLAGLRK